MNAFSAVSNGAFTKAVAGRVGPAIDLGGGGATALTPAYLNVSDGTFPTGTSFTFEAWVNFRTINAGQFIGLVVKGRECLNFDGDPDTGGGVCTVAPCGDWIGLYRLGDGGGNEVFSLDRSRSPRTARTATTVCRTRVSSSTTARTEPARS